MTPDQLISPLGVPERLFGLGEVVVDGPHATGWMQTAAWMRHDSGRPAAGALGVVLDVVVGQPTLSARPSEDWPVTTELSIDVVRAPDPAGERVDVEGSLVAVDGAVALSRGSAVGADGSVLALANARTRYTPGLPDLAAAESNDASGVLATAATQSSLRGALGGEYVFGDDTDHTGNRGGGGDVAGGLRVPPSPGLLNAAGNVHGGILVGLADVLATAVWERHGSSELATAAIRFAYLRPAPDTPLELTARLRHRGRTTALVDVEAVGGDGRPCAVGRVSALAPGSGRSLLAGSLLG